MQCVQIVRTRRWARNARTVLESKNGSMPMSSKRVMPPTASLVCSVENTRCPRQRGADGDVRRLAIADLADHDDVRVLPQNVPQAVGEAQPDLGFHVDLRNARQPVFDWFLNGDDAPLHRVDARQGKLYSVVDLPDPVGPVTITMPLGCPSNPLTSFVCAFVEVEPLEAETFPVACR